MFGYGGDWRWRDTKVVAAISAAVVVLGLVGLAARRSHRIPMPVPVPPPEEPRPLSEAINDSVESSDDQGGPSAEQSTEPGDDRDYPAGVWIARLHRVERFMPATAFFWIRARLSARFGDEYHWRNSDDKENDRGIPPADERITWRAIWMTEAFLPSSIEHLASGVERLGWWESHQRRSIADSIAAGRTGRGGGWANLPLLYRRTKRRTYGLKSFDRELPPGVTGITGHIHYVTPSLSVLIVGFRLDEPVSDALDTALRRRYRTFHEMTSWTGSRVMSPMFQRRDAVRDLEREAVAACRTWMRSRFPGYFAQGDDASMNPATMLVTTKRSVPFEGSDDMRFWAHEAGIEFATEQWDTTLAGLRYAFRPPDHGIALLAGRESDLFADDEKWATYGHEDRAWSLMYEIDSDLAPLMAFRTVDAVLGDSRRRLGLLRDSLSTFARTPSRKQLDSVQAQLGSMSSDLDALTLEVSRWPDQRSWVLHDIPDIKSVRDVFSQDETTSAEAKSLRSRLLDWCVESAADVRAFEVATRGLLIASAEIAATSENLRLQSLVRWVTIGTFVVALAALFVAATSSGR